MRVKTMLEASLNNDSRTVYFGNSKVGDTATQTVYIQVLADAAVSLTGTMAAEEDGQALACIAMADFTKVESITEEGMYMVIAEPLYSLTIASEDEVDIIVKAIA